jgi:general secretion pathway protein D
VLGNLFKSSNRKRVKTNLLVFLRPVVMRDQQALNELTMGRYESIRALQQTTQPEKSYTLPDTGAPLLPEKPPAPPVKPDAARKAAVPQ